MYVLQAHNGRVCALNFPRGIGRGAAGGLHGLMWAFWGWGRFTLDGHYFPSSLIISQGSRGGAVRVN